MTAFTQTQTGNWNDAATWGGGGYPQTSGDTATLGSTRTVTIPSGVAITCGAITCHASGSTLINNGTLDLAGSLTMTAGSVLNLGAGSVLDLNGQTVVGAGANTYTFVGSAESRISVISTGSRGSFSSPGNGSVPTFQYVDFSGLTDSVFGRCHGAAVPFSSIKDCTFVNMGGIDFDETNVSANSGFEILRCDFRSPFKANCSYPVVYNSAATTTRSRLIDSCTWDTDDVATNIWPRATNTTVSNCVIKHAKIKGVGADGMTITNNYWRGTNTEVLSFLTDGGNNYTISNNYLYYDGGDHPFSGQIAAFSVTGNIFDAKDGSVGLNWFLWGVTTSEFTMSIQRNVWLGWGIPLTFLNTGNPAIDFSRNTVLIDNQGQTGSGLAFSTILLTEQAGAFSGASLREVYNNILYDPDTSTGTQDSAIDLLTSTADQINYLNYNAGWSSPAGAPSPPVKYSTNVNVTSGEGVNDFAADPQFVDRTRAIASWDTSAGGAGTLASAELNMLKLNGYGGTWNSDYTPAALVTWTRAGFVPQSVLFDGTGRSGADVGAMDVVLAPAITVTAPAVDTVKLVGQTVTVEWTSVSITGTVDILLSADNGATYPITIVSGTANDGSYAFTALAVHVSATVKVKVVDSSNSDVYDEGAAFLIATTDPGNAYNTALWFRLQELAISDGLELSRP